MNAGDRLGKYRLTRQLGSGAMGVVWAAVNEGTNKEVALKLLASPNDDLRRRLLREAKAAGRLEHRNIVAIYDTGTTPQGEPFLVMQLLSGETLGSRLKRVGRLSPEIAAAIGAAVAAGLAAAHAENVVHRDLKPENVFLHREPGGAGEVVKVLDFGVSRVEMPDDAGSTATGMLIGSPAYMSPEQARGSKLDPRSDIWSLGVILFEMLTGARPFQGPSMAEAMVQVLTAPIPNVTWLVQRVPAGLSAIVTACLVRELEQRSPRARDVAAWLLPYATTASGQQNRVELPSLSGFAHPESTQLLEMGPRAARGGTVLMAVSEDEDDRRQTVPAPLPDGTLLVDAPALPLAPPPALPFGAGPTPSVTASSSTTPLMRVEPRPAPPSARSSTRAVPIVVALGGLAFAALVVGVLVIRARHAAEGTSMAVAPSARTTASVEPEPRAGSLREAPVPSAVTSTSAPAPPPDAPEPAVDPSGGVGVAAQASRSTTGELRINSIPVSRVLLDGRPLGTTPRLGLTVAAGPHSVVFVYSTGDRHTKSISVLPGTSELVTDRLPSAPAPAVTGAGF